MLPRLWTSSRFWLLAALFGATPMLSGFVLLTDKEAILPVSPASPQATFIWDGKAPKIQDKDKYRGGIYEGFDDVAMMQQLLNDAMCLWNNVPGSYVKLVVEPSSPGQPAADSGTDHVNSILVKKDANLSTAALARPLFDPNNPNVIDDCDVHINDTTVAAEDLGFIIAHELGHCLGLGHAHSNYGAIMGYSRAVRSMTLGDDDRAGIIYLYPDPTVWDGKAKELVCGVIGGANAAPSGGATGASLALLLLPLLAATRSRRRYFADIGHLLRLPRAALRTPR